VREVCEADLHVGVAFLLLTFLWRSKEK